MGFATRATRAAHRAPALGQRPTAVPIYQSITDPRARERLVATYDHDLSEHEWLLGYRWDIVLTGSHATYMEPEEDHRA